MRVNTVLVKFNLNEKWEGRFRAAGVPLRTPDEAALELKHVFSALDTNRNPYQFRPQIADSGVPVFGKDGARDISITGLFGELRRYGYSPTGVHIRTRGDKKSNVLVIPFVQPGSGQSAVAISTMGLIEEFSSASWGFVHVWINPPQEDGVVIHTVNLSYRDVGKVVSKSLHFQKGEWTLE
jgi:hypothetical protein